MACLLLLGITMSACGGDGDGGTPPSSTAITKNLAGSGDAQIGTVGEPLSAPIRVLITEDGVPSPSVTVTWSTTAAGASLTSTSTTDDAGIASNTWTLGTVAGPQTAQAALSGATGSPVTFNATANAGAATALSKPSGVSGDGQSAPINTALPSPLQAKVSDEFGNGVPGVEVGWATAADATLSAPVVITDGFGNSSVQVTMGPTEGPITITATADGLSGSPQTFTATAGPAQPVSATVNVNNNSFSPTALTVPVGTTVTWRWGATAVNHNVAPGTPGGEPPGSGSPSSAPETYTHQFNTPGTYIYYCQVHGTPTTGMRGTITVQ